MTTTNEYIEALCRENEYMKDVNKDLWRRVEGYCRTITELNIEIDRLTKTSFGKD